MVGVLRRATVGSHPATPATPSPVGSREGRGRSANVRDLPDGQTDLRDVGMVVGSSGCGIVARHSEIYKGFRAEPGNVRASFEVRFKRGWSRAKKSLQWALVARDPIPTFWLDVHDYTAQIRTGIVSPLSQPELDEKPAWWVNKLVEFINVKNEADQAMRDMRS